MPSQYIFSTEYPLRVWQVAKMLGLRERAVRAAAKSGRLKAIKNGPKIWCFRREEVEQFRRGRQAAAARRVSKTELPERARVSIGVGTRSPEAAFNPA